MSYSENNRRNFRPIKCSICRFEIKDPSNAYQSALNFGMVCNECNDNFSKEDIDLMSNIFLAYGGYFGKYKNLKTSIGDIVKKVVKQVENDPKKIELEELNIRLVHEALLHGFTPGSYIEGLKKFLDEL
ncbi:MAG: hypothetical protein ACTSRI_15130 [Promethearchaeota archaeon]